MSSHHIIREKQEPALLILELATFDKELLGQLLEWSPTVIVSEDAYEHVWSLGIKIDVVLKQNQSFSETQEHIKVYDVECEDVVGSAMAFLIQQEYPSVNIISSEFSVEKYSPFVNKLDVVVFVNHQKIFPVKSGFAKWKPAGDKIFVISEDTGAISCEGLQQEANNQYITLKDGFYRLNFDRDFIFIAEEI